jgi:hypothetical protein
VGLNEFIQNSATTFSTFLNDVKANETAEEHFDMNEFIDTSRQSKPKIYISAEEVYDVHRSFEQYVDELVFLTFF